MALERLELGSALIYFICYYKPFLKEKRMSQLHSAVNNAIKNQGELYIDEIEKLLKSFKDEMLSYRVSEPGKELDDNERQRLSKLESSPLFSKL